MPTRAKPTGNAGDSRRQAERWPAGKAHVDVGLCCPLGEDTIEQRAGSRQESQRLKLLWATPSARSLRPRRCLLEAFDWWWREGKRVSLHAETNSIRSARDAHAEGRTHRPARPHWSRPAVVAVEEVSRAADPRRMDPAERIIYCTFVGRRRCAPLREAKARGCRITADARTKCCLSTDDYARLRCHRVNPSGP